LTRRTSGTGLSRNRTGLAWNTGLPDTIRLTRRGRPGLPRRRRRPPLLPRHRRRSTRLTRST
ncbi:hypothetical protein AB4305_28975, partial [Nocardia sp. 2YAB30]|uniref:hypothetical protein n=1 Tax=unclassified Nocardia TaxID=2637762 RepID=UPI003F97DC67